MSYSRGYRAKIIGTKLYSYLENENSDSKYPWYKIIYQYSYESALIKYRFTYMRTVNDNSINNNSIIQHNYNPSTFELSVMVPCCAAGELACRTLISQVSSN